MITTKQQHKDCLEFDLRGTHGNAFYLLGLARQLGKQVGMTNEEISDLQKRMRSSDYDNLLKEFDSVFGDFVILYV